VAAPATASGKTTPLLITGQPGRSASVVDPRARRPAIARAADLGRGDRWFVSFAASPAILLFPPTACEGVMPGIVSSALNESGADLRRRLIAIYAVLNRRQCSHLALGARRPGRSADPARDGAACLHVRPAPRGRRRPYRGDRQCYPQADAARPAAGRRRLLLCARLLCRHSVPIGRRRVRRDSAHL
jgi:hypothetical protein